MSASTSLWQPAYEGYVPMPSGLLLPEAHAERVMRAGRLPRAMDFFAGAGGMSLGFIQAGYEVYAAAEWNNVAVVTYMTNLCRWGEVTLHYVTDDARIQFEKTITRMYKAAGVRIVDGDVVHDGKTQLGAVPLAGTGWIKGQPRSTPGVKHIFVGDVRMLAGERILADIGMKKGELDCVSGGPPCQGYSSAGKQNIYDPRNSLVFEWARLICELYPKTMVMEEVPAILTMVTSEGVPVIDQLCSILESGDFGGYEAFKRAIKVQTGAIGLKQGGKLARGDAKLKKPAVTKAKAEALPDLFGAAP